jgi:polysaccharide biosynthesis protein PslG
MIITMSNHRLRFGAALPKPVDVADTLGVHGHMLQLTPNAQPSDPAGYPPFLTNTDLDAMKAAGLKTVRSDMLWGAVERNKGHYDFSKYDALVKAIKARGMRPMFILGLGNPHDDSGHLSIHPKSNRDGFMHYAKACVEHFKGQGLIWELVQQPNMAFFWHPSPNAKDYADLANELLPQLKALDDSASFIAPSLAGHGLDYQQALYPHGILQHVDAVSVHPYRGPHRNPESIIKNYQATKALIAQHNPKNPDIPVILGEWGYHRNEVSAEQQANLAQRQALMGMMLGSPINVWHTWKGDIMSVTDRADDDEQQRGLVNKAVQPFPVYHALQDLSQQLKGFHFSHRVPMDDPDQFVLSFKTKPTGDADPTEKWVAWTTKPKGEIVTIPNHYVPTKLTEKPVFIERFAFPNPATEGV